MLFLQVNRQEPITDIKYLSFDVSDNSKWEHLLTGEPTELRVDCPIPDDIDNLTADEDLAKEKHLDMPTSWVQQLRIGYTGLREMFFELSFYIYHLLLTFAIRIRRTISERRQNHSLQARHL